MIGSTLVTKTIQANTSNYTKGRTSTVSEITVHHVAGSSTIEVIGAGWQKPDRGGSSHYGVYETAIGQFVGEEDTAWCNSNWASNCRAISIEVANAPSVTGKNYEETIVKGNEQGWPVTSTTLASTIRLIADIAKRNKLYPLILGKTLTWHSMYSATACPGPHLLSKLQYIVDEANKINAAMESNPNAETLYAVMRQVIALSDVTKAKNYAAQLNKEDPTAYFQVLPVNDIKALRK